VSVVDQDIALNHRDFYSNLQRPPEFVFRRILRAASQFEAVTGSTCISDGVRRYEGGVILSGQ